MHEGEISVDGPRAEDVRELLELLERHLAFANAHSPSEDVQMRGSELSS